MESLLEDLLKALHLPLVPGWHWSALVTTMVVSILGLGKGADWLVDLAVSLSLRWGMPRVVVGATIVSLGTTTPEAVVSVMAAFAGSPQIALGNAVGSIICDTGLILGIGCLIAPLPIDPRVANRQGWMQFGAGFLLVALCFPWADPASAFTTGGVLPQWGGWLLVGLLVAYLWWSVRMAHQMPAEEGSAAEAEEHGVFRIVLCMLAAFALVVVSSAFLIATAKELALRMEIPPAVIAATLVAFGTSLPELTIVVTATLKGQGELAIGNVIGADILNVLFVAGAAATVTPAGLLAVPNFFQMQFPAMLFVLLVFRIGIWEAKDRKLKRSFGVVLVAAYIAVTVLSFLVSGPAPSVH
ncbi:MAG: sodium:calcium antiporter [Planctomycetaceae bacterium]|nr:sodium:calcium antiporter [Planctomycetaceae bacterium]